MRGKGPGAAVSLRWIGAAFTDVPSNRRECPHGWDFPDADRAGSLAAGRDRNVRGGPARGDDPLPYDAGPTASPTPGRIDTGPRIIRKYPEPHGFKRQVSPDRPDFSRSAGSGIQPDPSADHRCIQSHIAVFLVAQAGGGGTRALGGSGLAGTSGRRADEAIDARRGAEATGRRPAARRPTGDAAIRRTQAGAPDLTATPLPGRPGMPGLPTPAPMMPPAVNAAELGGQSISLQLALYGALTSNPDLVALRQGNPIAPSAEAVEVARRFPTTLNPTVWIDYRPITLIPPDTFGRRARAVAPRATTVASITTARITSSSRSGSPSSWGTRRPTATTSPRPPMSSSSGT